MYLVENASVIPNNAENIPILFSGLTASSKTNISKSIAGLLDRPWFDATSELLRLADVHSDEKSVWATNTARIIQSARQGDEIDKELDIRLISRLENSTNSVVDAWAAPWLWKGKAVRVFVRADDETRINRCLASYPNGAKPTIEDARKLIEDKDLYTRNLFLRLYGFDLFTDHDEFDVQLDTSGFYADTPEKSGAEIARERILPLAMCAIKTALEK